MFSSTLKGSVKMYLVECKPDTVLVYILTRTSKKNIEHVGNKTELLKRLVKSTDAKGIADEDPWAHQPPLLNRFEETQNQNLTTCEIRIFHQKGRNNLLVMLCPRLEDWILKAANEANINLQHFGLPNNAEELHRLINIRTDNFEKLVENIKDKSDRIKRLKNCLAST